MWQKVIFCLFFDFQEGQNFIKSLRNGWECVTFHEKSRNVDFSQNGVAKWKGRAGGESLWGDKTCFLPEKTKNDPKYSKFLGICAGAELFCAMLLQGRLGQDVEGIGPFSPFLCFDQPPWIWRLKFWHFYKTMTPVQKVTEVFILWHVMDKKISQFSKIHLLLLWNIIWVRLVPMCETRNFVEMERNEGDRGLLNSWGNFWEWGGMLGSRGKWNLRDWVRGRGPKGQNTGPT